MANKALRFTSRTQRSSSQRYFVIDDPSWCAAALLLVLTLSSSAFFIDQTQLVYLCVVDGVLLLHGCYLRGKLMSLIKLFVVQLLVTCCLYLLMQQSDRMLEGVMAVCRLLLAAIPGWWLAMSCSPERIAEVLNWVMPVKWAFVVAASISLLPFFSREIQEIYAIQRMRGANISAKALRNPRHWPELVHCILVPLLIQLLKLAKQMANAAKLRQFDQRQKTTFWRY